VYERKLHTVICRKQPTAKPPKIQEFALQNRFWPTIFTYHNHHPQPKNELFSDFWHYVKLRYFDNFDFLFLIFDFSYVKIQKSKCKM